MKNPKIRFFLKSKQKNVEERNSAEPLYAEISAGFGKIIDGKQFNDKFQVSLETKIKPKHFGEIKEKRGIKNYVYSAEIMGKNHLVTTEPRKKIDRFIEAITTVKKTYENKYPTISEFKNSLLDELGRNTEKKTETNTVLNFLHETINYLVSIIGSGQRDEIKDKSINSYRNLVPIIERYQSATKTILTFENLDETTYRNIWIVSDQIIKGKIKLDTYTKKHKNVGLASSTKKAYQTYLLLLCKKAHKKKIKIKLDLLDNNLINKVDATDNEKTQAYLTEEQLKKVLDYEPKSPNLKLAQEYIIIASLTGMRKQSMEEANGEKIENFNQEDYNFNYILTKQEKTKTECLTPIFPLVKKIIMDNNGKFPDFTTERISLANLNKNIRKILQHIEIPNHKNFSTHNLRSTYVSNLAKLHIPESIISYVTHPAKKDKSNSTYIYVRLNMEAKVKMVVDWLEKIKTKTELYKI